MFERYFVRKPTWLHQANPSDVTTIRPVHAIWTVCATCSWESSSWWTTADASSQISFISCLWSDLDLSHWWLYDIPTRDDECLFCLDYFLCLDVQLDARHLPLWGTARRHRPVSTCCLPSLYPIDITSPRDSEHPYHPIAVDGNSLVGSTRVRGPTTGSSFSILCLILLIDWTCLFITTFNIIDL